MKLRIPHFILVFLLLNVYTLHAQRPTAETAPAQILFLTFRLEKDSTAATGETIRLTNSQKVAGQLKRPLQTPQRPNADDLICEFLDKQGAVLATQILEDPLTASVEYSDENGILKRVFLEKKEADLFLRVPYNPLFHKLRISKTIPNGTPLILADFLDP